jgi:hypothetical protein
MVTTMSFWNLEASAEFVRAELKPDEQGQFYCNDAGDWCFGLASVPENGQGHTAPVLVVRHRGNEVSRQKIELGSADDEEVFGWQKTGIWPAWIHDPERDNAFLMGITTTTSAGYSGGGASVSMLSLIRAETALKGGTTTKVPSFDVVAIVPIKSSKMIRACFSEQDVIDRHEQCHDVYEFKADIAPLNDTAGQGLPALQYQARASKFPPWADLMKDTTTKPPLDDEDMVKAPDPDCSFDRVFGFDAGAGQYQIDLPVSACSTYWVP